jgi:uncharacterized integral membrane protein
MLIRLFVIIVFFFLFLFFGVQNYQQEVTVRFLHYETPSLSLSFVIFSAFAAGSLFVFLLLALYILRLKNRMRKIQREEKKIREELNRLRNANIEEELEPAESPEPV